MSTPNSRAGYLRGGLVGVCSALVTGLAHGMAGGGVPESGTLAVFLVVCATVGAAVGGMTGDGRHARTGLVVVALCVGQASGHAALTLADGHYGHSGWLVTAPMLGVHLAAAVGLGVLISVVEYLYVLCASVLCWLRLFTLDQVPATTRALCQSSNVIVAQTVLLRSGMGMRAPPRPPFVRA